MSLYYCPKYHQFFLVKKVENKTGSWFNYFKVKLVKLK